MYSLIIIRNNNNNNKNKISESKISPDASFYFIFI